MEKEEKQSADLLRLVTWLHANRKKLMAWGVGILALAAIVGIYVWYGNHRETASAEAVSAIRLPQPPLAPTAFDPGLVESYKKEVDTYLKVAGDYTKVADEYPGTKGAARARLLAGQVFFVAGKYDQAQQQFERFLADSPEFPLATEGLLGVAACLEAQNKNEAAAEKYKALIDHHPNDAVISQAKSALARLYVTMNKPEAAMRLYEELQKSGLNDTWTLEASIQIEELKTQFPELNKPPPSSAISVPPPLASATATVPTMATATNPPAKPAMPPAVKPAVPPVSKPK